MFIYVLEQERTKVRRINQTSKSMLEASFRYSAVVPEWIVEEDYDGGLDQQHGNKVASVNSAIEKFNGAITD